MSAPSKDLSCGVFQQSFTKISKWNIILAKRDFSGVSISMDRLYFMEKPFLMRWTTSAEIQDRSKSPKKYKLKRKP